MLVRIVGCERGVEKENGSGHTPELFFYVLLVLCVEVEKECMC